MPAAAADGAAPTTAILLINLGTPDAPTPAAVRRYLREFLSDRRVVEQSRLLWWPILNGVILRRRPRRSAARYAAIWTAEGSPLLWHTERQAKLLRGLLGEAGHTLRIEYAMRYGKPALAEQLDALTASGVSRVLLLPLYPQYSASTTATAFDAAFAWASRQRNQPELRLLRSFPDDPGYIAALAASVRRHWAQYGRPETGGGHAYRLLMSFHGIPARCIELGDPYREECLLTARLLTSALGLGEGEYVVCFQSRFGRSRWLPPATSDTLHQLAKTGVRRVDVLCPGFPADCLETLEEIAIEGKATFLDAGGAEFNYIACLNEQDDWIRALAQLALKHLQGWNLA